MNNDVNLTQSPPRIKPQPWRCGECREKAVYLENIDFSIDANHDGHMHKLHLPVFEVGKCRNCGYITIPHHSAMKIDDALVEAAGILTSAAIRENLHRLQLEPAALAEYLGVDAETVSLWADGRRMQSKAQDQLMRVYFNVPAARKYLDDLKHDREIHAASDLVVSA